MIFHESILTGRVGNAILNLKINCALSNKINLNARRIFESQYDDSENDDDHTHTHTKTETVD